MERLRYGISGLVDKSKSTRKAKASSDDSSRGIYPVRCCEYQISTGIVKAILVFAFTTLMTIE